MVDEGGSGESRCGAWWFVWPSSHTCQPYSDMQCGMRPTYAKCNLNAKQVVARSSHTIRYTVEAWVYRHMSRHVIPATLWPVWADEVVPDRLKLSWGAA